MDKPYYTICCIGHITQDKVVNPGSEVFMAGGTAFYFSHAMRQMPVSYSLVTAVGNEGMVYAQQLRDTGIDVIKLPSENTVYFENSYTANPDERSQRVLQKADPFTAEHLLGIDAQLFHLGPLLADDLEPGLIKHLAAKGKVSLDAQGLLREVVNTQVIPIDWSEKLEALPYVEILKVNEHELTVLTGENDIKAGAKILAGIGVKEVVITLGSEGSLIYTDDVFYTIEACKPETFKDATGCGDTYMAGYLYKRVNGADIREAGRFASAMAGLKAGISGPFTGTEAEVAKFRDNHIAFGFRANN